MGETKYETVAASLRRDIAGGLYGESQRIPSDNELMASTGYSRQTIRQAIDLLVKENIVHRVRGSGTYVVGIRKRPATHNIAVVSSYIGAYIFPDILRGIESVLSASGFTSMLSATRNRVDNERRILLDLLTKPIDGLIVEGTTTALPNPNIDLYQRFNEQNIPVVFINCCYPEIKNPVYVVTDDRAGGRMACRYLLERGHKAIGGVFKCDDIQGHLRYAGFVEELIAAGCMVDDTKVWWYTTNSRETVLHLALSQMSECTGVVCYNDLTASFLAGELASAENRPVLVSFDNSANAKLSPLPIVSLHCPKDQIGSRAAVKLLELLEGGKSSCEALPWSFAETDT